MKRLLFFYLLLGASLTGYGQDVISGKSNPVYVNVGNEVMKDEEIVIAWLSPKISESTSDNKELNLKIGMNAPSEIIDVDIYINNLLVDGKNEIKIVAKTANKSKTDIRVINFENKVVAVAKRRDYALLFATDVYDEWGHLVNPINDAKTIAKELTDYYGYEVELVTNNTIDDILIKLREYATKSYMDDDQLFIFFAGHGRLGDYFYFVFTINKNQFLFDGFVKISFIFFYHTKTSVFANR